VPFEAQVLNAMGDWLRRHDEVALTASPAALPPQPWGSVMLDEQGLVLFVRDWQPGELVVSGLVSEPRAVRVSGQDAPLAWRRRGDDLLIELPHAAPDPVLPVLRVELDGVPRIIQPGSVALSASAETVLPMDFWQPRIRFAYGEGYFTQRESIVALDAAVRHQGEVSSLWLRFADVEAPARQRYRVDVGGQWYEVDAATLAREAIGPFALSPEAPGTRIRMTLAAPEYPAQALELHFGSVTVSAQPLP